MSERRMLLTGASGGLGLEFTRQWLEGGHRVFALARRPDDSGGLNELKAKHGDALFLGTCDISSTESVEAAARQVGEATDALDVVLNNAGTYGTRQATLDTLDFDEVRRAFEVNTLGTLRVTHAMLPLLRRGEAPRLIHMTSLMGSLGDNGSGGAYAYRMSKAALNVASVNLSHELRAAGIPSVVLHPGWVHTGMGGPGAPLTAEESVAAMIRTIDSIGAGHSGRFLDRSGEPLPW